MSDNESGQAQNHRIPGCILPIAAFCLVFGVLLVYERSKCRSREEIVGDYAKIEIGMSREQIAGLLRKYPLSEIRENTDQSLAAEEFQVAEVQAALFAPDLIYIFYAGGKVTGKYFIPTDPSSAVFFPPEMPGASPGKSAERE